MIIYPSKSFIALTPEQQFKKLAKLPNGEVLRLLNVHEVIDSLPKTPAFWSKLAERKLRDAAASSPTDLQSFKSVLLDTQIAALREYVINRTAFTDDLASKPSNVDCEPEYRYALLKKNLIAFYKTLALKNLFLMEVPPSLIEEHQEAMFEACKKYMEQNGSLSLLGEKDEPFPFELDFICEVVRNRGEVIFLELDGCGLTDEHCPKLAKLAAEGLISELLLPNNKITDEGYRILSEQLSNPASKLFNIDLDNNLLTPA